MGKYDTVIFDLDGVITSEQKYWDAAALTVYQLITEPFDVGYASRNVSLIRTLMFYNDRTITLLKDLGVNSNWDLAYVVYAFMQILGTYDSVAVFESIKKLNLTALKLYEYIETHTALGGRNGNAYKYLVKIFQEWYLGDELYRAVYTDGLSVGGKPGLAHDEQPLLDKDKTVKLLKTLSEAKTLGVATGRQFEEAAQPLRNWGVYCCFSQDNFATYTDVINAENETHSGPYTKPHPFLFALGSVGKSIGYKAVLSGEFDKSHLGKTLAVGDAGADLMSAKAAGIDFAAVLTGVSGEKARSFFEENGADYILNSILDLAVEKTR